MSDSGEIDPMPGEAEAAEPVAPLTRRQRATKFMLAAVPLLVIVTFFGYIWWISGVLPHVEKYPNGKPKVLGYVKREGTTYHRTGRWVLFHPNNQKAAEGFYQHDQKVPGTWHYWDESGRELPGEPASEPGTAASQPGNAPARQSTTSAGSPIND